MQRELRFLAVHPLGNTDPWNLPVSDVLLAVSFYTEALGFSLHDLEGEPPETATITRDAVTLRLVRQWKGAEEANCYVEVTDVDALLEEYVARSVVIAGEPQVMQANGQRYRGFFVRDPDGGCLCLGSLQGPAHTITHMKEMTVFVSDQRRALEYYVHTLGFEARHDEMDDLGQRIFEVAPPGARTGVLLVQAAATDPRVGIPTGIIWSCDDLDATHALLHSRGVEFLHTPHKETKGVAALFRDQDGNIFSLVEA